MLSNDLATYKDGTVTFADGMTGADIAKKMGLSEDALKSMLGLLEEFGGKVDWSVLFPDELLLEEENKPESVIDEKAKQLVEDAGGYGASADEAVKLITEANKKVNDALGGNMPEAVDTPTQPTVVDTPLQDEVVDVPIGSNVPSTTMQTVFVNVETGDPISASALLLSVTENEDGSLSYDVQANASAGDTLDEGALILNVVKNEDGSYSYDVFVNGTPGKTIGKDSIVLGTNTEDGTYSVTVNGAAGNALSQSSGLILGLDENGQWNVVTNATQGTTVDRGNLVTGDDPTVYVDADTSAALSKVETLNALANAPATKTVTVKYKSYEMPEVYDEPLMPEVHDEPLMPEVADVPINPVLDDSSMEGVHDELIDSTSDAEKDTPPLIVPVDIDAQSLQNAVLAAGDDQTPLKSPWIPIPLRVKSVQKSSRNISKSSILKSPSRSRKRVGLLDLPRHRAQKAPNQAFT